MERSNGGIELDASVIPQGLGLPEILIILVLSIGVILLFLSGISLMLSLRRFKATRLGSAFPRWRASRILFTSGVILFVVGVAVKLLIVSDVLYVFSAIWQATPFVLSIVAIWSSTMLMVWDSQTVGGSAERKITSRMVGIAAVFNFILSAFSIIMILSPSFPGFS